MVEGPETARSTQSELKETKPHCKGRQAQPTAIFDLDGTLLDTLDDLAASTNYALSHHELPGRTRDQVRQYVGIPVSIGFAPTRTLAKIANHIAKKDHRITDGVYWLVRPEAIDIILRRTAIEDVWGIGRRLAASLKSKGIITAADFVKMPSSLVRSQYSVTLERTQRELMGHDCQIANPVTIAHKTIMTSRTFGKVLTNRDEIADAIVSFAERTARQLRDEGSVASSVMTYVRGDHFREDLPFYSNSCQLQLATPTSDTMTIVRQALVAFNNIWRDGFGYRKAGVMALDIQHGGAIQLNVFDPEDHGKLRRLMTSIDGINNLYGRRSVKLAPGLQRGEWAPNQNHFQPLSKTLHFYTGMIHPYPALDASVTRECDEEENADTADNLFS